MLKLFKHSMIHCSYHPQVNVRWKEEMDGLISFIHFHSGRCGNVCFHSVPDDMGVVSVYVPTHQARHWNILTTTVKEMDTNWVKTGFTSFLPIFNHMVPSKTHHHVPQLHLCPLCISSLSPPTSYSPWRCWLQCTLTHWSSFNI